VAGDDKRDKPRPRWAEDAATIISPGGGGQGGGRRPPPPQPPPQRSPGRSQGNLEVIDLAAEEDEFIDAEPEEQLPQRGGRGRPSPRPQAGRGPQRGDDVRGPSRALTQSRVRPQDDEYGGGDGPTTQAVVPAGHFQRQPRGTSGTPAVMSMPTPFRAREVGSMCPDDALFMVHQPDSEQAAQYRLLKFRLKESGDPRVIALTSAGPNEGQTIAVANLALALAEGRRTRVIILEANLRRPSLPKLFGIEESGGLTEQLRRRRRDPDGPWDVLELANGFHLLHAGKPAENPAAMLNSEEFARLVGELRIHYDYVVCDTPPMLDNTDMTIVQDLMDAVILVCRSGASDRTHVRKAQQRMSPHNLIGLLLI
jgi:capsular exopolysaccharide synthesis family protein